MMSGKERREEILQRITNSKTPVSGAALAKSCEAVSYTHLTLPTT